MYAIVKTGGKQYKVSPGDIVQVEKLEGKVGDTVVLQDILMLVDDETKTVNCPVTATAKVTGEIIGQLKRKKVIIFKARRRKGYRKQTGHRQLFTKLKITEINA